MVKVFIVEDSFVIQKLLVHILDADPEIEVVGMAETGEKAIRILTDLRNTSLPDVITMDIIMPGIDGLETIRRIMQIEPIPIIVVSSHLNDNSMDNTFDALNAGAVTAMGTPPGIGHPDYQKKANELIQKVKLISGVKVIKRRLLSDNIKNEQSSLKKEPTIGDVQLIAIGASTGGPVVIKQILSRLTTDFSVPVLIVQHISEGFSHGFAEWLNREIALKVKLAEDNEQIYPGNVYIAPDDFHMGIASYNRIILKRDEFVNGLRPSVSYLFHSIAHICPEQSIGVLLTGMGSDGSNELKLLREKGAFTIAQDEESSIIFGMPRKSIEIGGAQFILSPEMIAEKLISLTNKEIKNGL